MQRKFIARHKVNVYASDAPDAQRVARIHVKPWSFHGFDNYKHGPTLYPGFADKRDTTADGCIFLNLPCAG